MNTGLRTDKSLQALNAIQAHEKGIARLEAALARLYPNPWEVDRKMYDELEKCRQSEPDWILQSSDYQKWVAESDEEHKLLWALGRPGAGKTCIASFIANKLFEWNDQSSTRTPQGEERHSNRSVNKSDAIEQQSFIPNQVDTPELPIPSVRFIDRKRASGVALFYCNFQNPQGQDVETVFRCLCMQLLDQLHNLDFSCAQKYLKDLEQLGRTRSSPKAVVRSLLLSLLATLKPSYIIIDALDENPDSYEELYSELRQLITHPGVRLLVTSRDGEQGHMHQDALDAKAILVQIHPEDQQIRAYVESKLSEIADSGRSGLADAVKDTKERNDIAQKITFAADSNYLCAELQIAMLRSDTKETLQRRLNNLPKTLKSLFHDTMKRIQKEDERNGWQRGRRALMWTLYAIRPLTVEELSDALAIYSTSRRDQVAGTDGPTAQEIVEATCYFLSVDKESLRISVHKAVKDYCESSGREVEQDYFGKPHFDMAECCLQYLDSDRFASGPSASVEDWRSRVKDNPFFLYAAQSWGWHVGATEESQFLKPDSDYNIVDLLQNEPMTDVIAQALQEPLRNASKGAEIYTVEESEWVQLTFGSETLMPARHILVYFKLEKSAKTLLSKQPEAISLPSRTGYTPLWLACLLGHRKIVRLLLDKGGDPSVECPTRRYCLAAAAFHDHLEVVKLLLNHRKRERLGDVLVRQHNWHGRLPVADAAAEGRDDIFQVFLNHIDHMSDRDEILLHQDHSGQTLLHEAARNNQATIISILKHHLGNRAIFSALLRQQEKSWGDYPIHGAAGNSSMQSLEVLLSIETAAQLDFRQNQGKTPLFLAIEHDHSAQMTELFLHYGADPTFRNPKDGQNCLHFAAFCGQPYSIKRLLKDERCQQLLEAPDNQGRTPLTVARETRSGDWTGVMTALFSAGANGVLYSVRHEQNSYTHVAYNLCFLGSSHIPSSARLPIQSIVFKIESHNSRRDPNVPDLPPATRSYEHSPTWFEAAIYRNSQWEPRRTLVAFNPRPDHITWVLEMTWSIDAGYSGGGGRAQGHKEQEEVKDFLRSIKHGDSVGVFPRSNNPGWRNCVHEMEIFVFHDELKEAENPQDSEVQ